MTDDTKAVSAAVREWIARLQLLQAEALTADQALEAALRERDEVVARGMLPGETALGFVDRVAAANKKMAAATEEARARMKRATEALATAPPGTEQ
jgi:hypothetical protein